MELAMHCRDSGSWFLVRVFDRSEWTVGIRHRLLAVAFPGCVRQRLFELGDEPRDKVTCLAVSVIDRGVRARVGQRSRGTCSLVWAGLSCPSQLSTMADCVQCA